MRELFIKEINEKFIFNNTHTYKIDNTELDSFIEEWEDELSADNISFFEKKLKEENITTENFKKIIGSVISSKNNLNLQIETQKLDTNNEFNLGVLIIFDCLLNKNFTKVIEVLKHYNHFFSLNEKQLLNSYKNHTLSSIAKISEKTIFHEFKFWDERFIGDLSEFSSRLSNKHYRKYFYNKYPLLIRLVNDEINRAYDFIIEILSALKNDWESIKEIIKGIEILEDLNFGLGDRHVSGKSVTIVIFNDDLKFIYKPHSLEIDDSYSKFIEFFINKNLKYRIKNPKVIVRNNYGWQEFITQLKTDDNEKLKEFYYKTGVHLCLFYILNGNDLHYENIIGVSKTPMIIDMETLLSPLITRNKNIHLKSVYDVGLLPFGIYSGETFFQFGGLTNPKSQKSPFKKNTVNIEEREIITEDIYMDESKNLPYKKDIDLKNFINDIIDGFSDSYEILLKNKDDLFEIINSFFSNSKIRFITRNTMAFTHLLNEAFHPYLMTNGFLLEKHLDLLWLAVKDILYLEKVIISEKNSLLNLDIPYFYTFYNSKSLFDFENKKIDNFFDLSPKENIEQSIKNISSDDKVRQIWIVKASIISYIKN
jgi:type 2 lantibiotic biosynthesis protein LanM